MPKSKKEKTEEPKKEKKALKKAASVAKAPEPAPVPELPKVLVPKKPAKPVATKPVAAPKPKAEKAPKAEKPAPVITITFEDISLRAYFIAEHRQKHGLPGDSTGDWVEAERQLVAEAAPAPKKKK